MPRTTEEIVAQAAELAKRFEDFDPEPGTALDGAPLRAVREAFEDLAAAQKRLTERVAVAKASGHAWGLIGAMLGTSGEAARQRYGHPSSCTVSPATPAGPVKKAATKADPAKVATTKGNPGAGTVKLKRKASGTFTQTGQHSRARSAGP